MNEISFAPLTDEEKIKAEIEKSKPDNKRPLILPLKDAPPLDYRHKRGDPQGWWRYIDADGNLHGYVLRWDYTDAKGAKQKLILPITYCELKSGRRQWAAKGMAAPRPLLSLPAIINEDNLFKPVMIVEGEKTATYAQRLFPDFVVTTTCQGAQSPHLTDFSFLYGRKVIICPDNDKAGTEYGDKVCELLRKVGAGQISYLPPERLGSLIWQDGKAEKRNGELPQGWDLADAYDEGWTDELVKMAMEEDPDFIIPYQTADERETKRRIAEGEPEEMARTRFRLTANGVEEHIVRTNKDGENVYDEWVWLCSPLEVVADTRNNDNDNWGRLLRLKDPDNFEKEWLMPMAMLAGDGNEIRARLLSMGLKHSNAPRAKKSLEDYIRAMNPKQKVRCVNQIGWHNQSFILPKETFEQEESEIVRFQNDDLVDDPYRVAGTLEGWQDEVARLAIGNSRLIFALSAAFAAPLTYLSGEKIGGGGFHLRGGSSVGKTTGLNVAASVWGGRDYVRTWRATSNGLEGIASMHCDTPLLLDEMGQGSGHEIGQVAYMLANGQGKNRARRDGSARKAASWRSLFLSTGELSLADKIAEDGRGRRVAAGQEVRIVDIPADAGAGLGMFENIHGFEKPDQFASHLKAVAAKHYGHASRQFLEYLTAGDLIETEQVLKKSLRDFIKQYCPDGADGQVSRVAERFALVAAGGELATACKIVPWQQGEATRAAAICFKAWLDGRGGIEPAEEREALAAVRYFLELHGNSRFELIVDGHIIEQKIQNRAGFRRNGNYGAEYFIFPEVWKNEVCRGLDPVFVARTLAERGFLEKDSQGKFSIVTRLPISSAFKPSRCYKVSSDILGEVVEELREAAE